MASLGWKKRPGRERGRGGLDSEEGGEAGIDTEQETEDGGIGTASHAESVRVASSTACACQCDSIDSEVSGDASIAGASQRCARLLLEESRRTGKRGGRRGWGGRRPADWLASCRPPRVGSGTPARPAAVSPGNYAALRVPSLDHAEGYQELPGRMEVLTV